MLIYVLPVFKLVLACKIIHNRVIQTDPNPFPLKFFENLNEYSFDESVRLRLDQFEFLFLFLVD